MILFVDGATLLESPSAKSLFYGSRGARRFSERGLTKTQRVGHATLFNMASSKALCENAPYTLDAYDLCSESPRLSPE
jgi:hypothetical protein